MVPFWGRRVVAAPLALWFLFTAFDSDALHDCPVHGGSRTHAAHAPAQSTPHAHHGIAADAAASSAKSNAGHDEHGQETCSCAGECCGPAPLAPVASRTDVAEANVVAAAAGAFPEAAALAPGDSQLVLPPSIGPPTLQT